MTQRSDRPTAREWAVQFHDIYEHLAPAFGYVTRTESRSFDASTPNGKLMIAVCEVLVPLIERAAYERGAFEQLQGSQHYFDEQRRAARADGFREGQERMRLSAAEYAATHARCCTGLALSDAIRALPLEVDDA